MRTTIKDVSRLAGVSIKTVSRVLNNERYVQDATRRKVQDAIAALNFRPNIAARSLAGNRSFQIALVCDNPSPYYVYELQHGTRERCEHDGVRMIAQSYDRHSERLLPELEALIDTTSIDGLILTPPVTDRRDVHELLTRRGVRFVRVSPGEVAPSSAIFIDNFAAAQAMTGHLIALGHQSIGFIIGDPSYAASHQRLAGFRDTMAQAGLAVEGSLIGQGSFDFASGAAAAEAMLRLAAPPSAIFASNDDMAAGALAVAHRMNISVPGQLSVAGFGDDELASYVWPSLTTIRQPIREIGFQAADLLLASADAPPEQREIAFELIVRDSTGRAH